MSFGSNRMHHIHAYFRTIFIGSIVHSSGKTFSLSLHRSHRFGSSRDTVLPKGVYRRYAAKARLLSAYEEWLRAVCTASLSLSAPTTRNSLPFLHFSNTSLERSTRTRISVKSCMVYTGFSALGSSRVKVFREIYGFSHRFGNHRSKSAWHFKWNIFHQDCD